MNNSTAIEGEPLRVVHRRPRRRRLPAGQRRDQPRERSRPVRSTRPGRWRTPRAAARASAPVRDARRAQACVPCRCGHDPERQGDGRHGAGQRAAHAEGQRSAAVAGRRAARATRRRSGLRALPAAAPPRSAARTAGPRRSGEHRCRCEPQPTARTVTPGRSASAAVAAQPLALQRLDPARVRLGQVGAGRCTLPGCLAWRRTAHAAPPAACRAPAPWGRPNGGCRPCAPAPAATAGSWPPPAPLFRARALNGIARKCVLPMRAAARLPAHHAWPAARLAAISLAASLGLKVRLIASSPSASIWRITALLAGNCLPSRHSCGCSASSQAHSAA